MIFPLDHQPASGAVGVQTVVFEEIPQEPIRFRFGGVFYQMDGAWQISFQIPEGGTDHDNKTLSLTSFPNAAFVFNTGLTQLFEGGI